MIKSIVTAIKSFNKEQKLLLNIFANFLGSGWTNILNLLFIPLYIKFLGIEAYGIIGIYATLFGFFSLFDLGVTSTVNRELALYSVQPKKSEEMRDFVRTLEVVFWIIGFILSISLAVSAPLISRYWLNAEEISIERITQSIIMMAIISFLQWPLRLYESGLLGIQKHVLLNAVTAIINLIRFSGSFLVLYLIEPTLTVFFSWQVFVSAVQIVIVTRLLWINLPCGNRKPKLNINIIKRIWRFSGSLGIISIISILRRQADKLILSRLVSLEIFGYYVLASNVSIALSLFVAPILKSIFPYLSILIEEGDEKKLIKFYHRSCQFVSLVAIPTALVVSFFSYEIIYVWTSNENTAKVVAPIVSILSLGTLFNGLASIPYDLQIAYGWTKLGIYKSVISFVVLVPAIYFLSKGFGPVGTSFAWLALNLGFVFIEVPIMHTKLLKMELFKWFRMDVGVPILTTATVVIIARMVSPQMNISIKIIPMLMTVSFLAFITTAFSLNMIKEEVRKIYLITKMKKVKEQIKVN